MCFPKGNLRLTSALAPFHLSSIDTSPNFQIQTLLDKSSGLFVSWNLLLGSSVVFLVAKNMALATFSPKIKNKRHPH